MALIGDQCGTDVIGVAEKGVCFFQVIAEGVSSHAAYGTDQSATHRLLDALDVIRSLERSTNEKSLEDRVTVNVGRLQGGVARNLVAATAFADVSIRVPTDMSTKALMAHACRELAERVSNVRVEIERASEPSATSVDSPIVCVLRGATKKALGTPAVAITRLGASDARLFRERNIPTAVYGPSPQNMGAVDDHLLIEELVAVSRVHAQVVLDFLFGIDDDGF
jgi:acetylornithine deacetylase/succinyl-diaminopimelate desuccinylase-like protein